MCSIYSQSSCSSTASSASSTPTKSPAGDRFISARLGQDAFSTFDTKAMIFDSKLTDICSFNEEDQENNHPGLSLRQTTCDENHRMYKTLL